MNTADYLEQLVTVASPPETSAGYEAMAARKSINRDSDWRTRKINGLVFLSLYLNASQKQIQFILINSIV